MTDALIVPAYPARGATSFWREGNHWLVGFQGADWVLDDLKLEIIASGSLLKVEERKGAAYEDYSGLPRSITERTLVISFPASEPE